MKNGSFIFLLQKKNIMTTKCTCKKCDEPNAGDHSHCATCCYGALILEYNPTCYWDSHKELTIEAFNAKRKLQMRRSRCSCCGSLGYNYQCIGSALPKIIRVCDDCWDERLR